MLLALALVSGANAAPVAAYDESVVRAWYEDLEGGGSVSTPDLLRKVTVGVAAAPESLRPDYLAEAARGLFARGGPGPWTQEGWEACAAPVGRGDYPLLILSHLPATCGMTGGGELWGPGGLTIDLSPEERREKVRTWLLKRPFFGWASPDALDHAAWFDLLRGQVTAEVLGGLAKTQLSAPERARLWALLQGASAVIAANPDEGLRRVVRKTLSALEDPDPAYLSVIYIAGMAEALEMASDADCGKAVAPLARREGPPIPTLLPGILDHCDVPGLDALSGPVADWAAPLGDADRERLGGDPVPLDGPVTVSAREWMIDRLAWDLMAPILAEDLQSGRLAAFQGSLARSLTRAPSQP